VPPSAWLLAMIWHQVALPDYADESQGTLGIVLVPQSLLLRRLPALGLAGVAFHPQSIRLLGVITCSASHAGVGYEDVVSVCAKVPKSRLARFACRLRRGLSSRSTCSRSSWCVRIRDESSASALPRNECPNWARFGWSRVRSWNCLAWQGNRVASGPKQDLKRWSSDNQDYDAFRRHGGKGRDVRARHQLRNIR